MASLEDVDASLQDFSYTFDCGSRREVLSFHTFKRRASPKEHEEIASIYSNHTVQMQSMGIAVVLEGEEEIENVRSFCFARRSLFGKFKSIRWKLYYSQDIDAGILTEAFIGFAGLSLSESGYLKPYLRLKEKYHNRGFGTKLLYCLVEKFRRHKAWLIENVRGIDIHIHPKNSGSLALQNKLLADSALENKNPVGVDGFWRKTYRWMQDKKCRTVTMRHFICNDMKALELLLERRMNQRINTADLLFLDNLEIGTQMEMFVQKNRPMCNFQCTQDAPSRESLNTFTTKGLMNNSAPENLQEPLTSQTKKKTREKACRAQDLDGALPGSTEKEKEDIDASLQQFRYTFDCGSRREALYFCTLQTRASPREHEEIRSIYGNHQVLYQVNGIHAIAESEQAIEIVRKSLYACNSLFNESKTIYWKIYYSRDIHANGQEETFAGYVGLTLGDSKHLEPHLLLNTECQNKGIGTKVTFCLLEKFLSHKAWVFENVKGVDMYIQFMNQGSLALRSKALSNYAMENKNPDDENGIWQKSYLFKIDQKNHTLSMRNFVCNDIKSLAILWESVMDQNVNTADLLLLDNLSSSERNPMDDDSDKA